MLDQSEFDFVLLDPKLKEISDHAFLDRAMQIGVPVIVCSDRNMDETKNGFAEAIDFFGKTCLQAVNTLFQPNALSRKNIQVGEDTLKPS